MPNRLALCLACGLFTLISGCGKSGPPPIYPVSGQVTLKGKPVQDLRVHFISTDDRPDRFVMGVGQTDANGAFTVVESAWGQGLPAGSYIVSFSYMVNSAGKSALGSGKDEGGGGATVTESIMPPYDYRPKSDSPERFTVSAGGNNIYKFDVPAAR